MRGHKSAPIVVWTLTRCDRDVSLRGTLGKRVLEWHFRHCSLVLLRSGSARSEANKPSGDEFLQVQVQVMTRPPT